MALAIDAKRASALAAARKSTGSPVLAFRSVKGSGLRGESGIFSSASGGLDTRTRATERVLNEREEDDDEAG